MTPNILVYIDDPTPGDATRFCRALMQALVAGGIRVSCAHSAALRTHLEDLRAAGVYCVALSHDSGSDFIRTAADPSEPGRVIDDMRPDLVIFGCGTPVASIAARHATLERKLPFINVVGQASAPVPQAAARCLNVAKAQYRQASAVLVFSEAELARLRNLMELPQEVGEVAAVERPSAEILLRHARASTAIEAAPNVEARENPAGDTVILIPTTNRPAMLRTALEGIRKQTARNRIRQVVVSENTPIAAHSAAVCAEFASELPMRFVHRQPALSPLDHGKILFSTEWGAPFTAILHDDDWWIPEHLARSLDALEAHSAGVCYSSFYDVTGESSPLRSDTNLLFWFGSNFARLTETWVLDPESVVISCLGGTPGRYSTLVARADVFRACSYVLGLGNTYDNDRMLNVAFATKGRVVFNPVPSAFIRIHGSQDSRRYHNQEIAQRMYETTRWLLEQAAGLNVDVCAAINRRLVACPESYRGAVLNTLSLPWVRAALKGRPGVPQPLLAAWREVEANVSQQPAARAA